ncbi:MAG TPA: hypothetical protein VNA04_00550 [Thermoanaerobaculia bacterium]|nr:hypothetical protein [Thermoanaerobaculia bacterium]
MFLTFIVGTASDAFSGELGTSVESELRSRYEFAPAAIAERYESEPVSAAGWLELQSLASSMLGERAAPCLTGVEAYQAVYIPRDVEGIDQVEVPGAADPLQVASLEALIGELTRFAETAQLPTDDLELMALAAEYLEEGGERELDFQTYVQLMLSARQAVARKQALWIVS